jgi:hypothetical protein
MSFRFSDVVSIIQAGQVVLNGRLEAVDSCVVLPRQYVTVPLLVVVAIHSCHIEADDLPT